MGCDVYANGDEIACKAGDGKVIAAFPDVCLTPPPPPAGPLPVPYPDTSFAKDMKDGSATVTIKGKEVMLKDASYYKSSPLGDEAATNSLGAGVVTHVITGKTYFVAWSMDVHVEGMNVDRHTDLTTSNHASPMANAAVPMLNAATSTGSGAQQMSLLCECCNLHPPHSQAQREGRSMTEAEFHSPTQTGLRKRTGKGGKDVLERRDLTGPEKADCGKAKASLGKLRSQCPEQVPNDPAQGPCDLYYEVTPDEKAASDELYEDLARPDNPFRPPAWSAPGTVMIAHRVPRAAGGCPVGAGNTRAVTSEDCRKLDGKLGSDQNKIVEIRRSQVLPTP